MRTNFNLAKGISLLFGKAVCAAVAVFLLFSPSPGEAASATFNTSSKDFPTLQVSNFSQDPGCATCWSRTTSNVKRGDVVSFLFYYHNTSAQAALDTALGMSFTYGASNIVASGKISANNASPIYGTAVIYPASGSGDHLRLSFHSVEWYPNHDSKTPNPLPAGQDGSSIIGNGVNIGAISPGWDHQGYLVVRFAVSDTATSRYVPAVSVKVIVQGSEVTRVAVKTKVKIEWSATNAQSCEAVQGGFATGGAVSGTVWYTMNDTATFVVRCSGSGGSAEAQKTVEVFKQRIEFKTIAKQTCSATLFEDLSGSVRLKVPLRDERGLLVDNGDTFTGGHTWVSSGKYSAERPLIEAYEDRYDFCGFLGSPVILDQFSESKIVTVVLVRKSFAADAPGATTLHASNITATSATLNGEVNPYGSATMYRFEYGRTPSLGYATPIKSAGSGKVTVRISENTKGLSPSTLYYFRVVAQNQHGTKQGPTLSFWTRSSLGDSSGSVGNPPVVKTDGATEEVVVVFRAKVNPNGSPTDAWFEYGTSPGSLTFKTDAVSVGSGTIFRSFSQSVSNVTRGKTYYVRAVASNRRGVNRGEIINFQTSGWGNTTSTATAYIAVFTEDPAYVFQNAAILRGEVQAASRPGHAWFEYGPTPTTLATTPVTPVGTHKVPITVATSGLVPGTLYYARAVMRDTSGIQRGQLITFETLPKSKARQVPGELSPVIVHTASANDDFPSGASSCLTLVPNTNKPHVASSEAISYTISYRNECPFALKNAELHISMPNELTFVAATPDGYEAGGQNVTYALGEVMPGEEKVVNIDGTVKEFVRGGDALIFGSTLSFEDQTNEPQAVSAYITAMAGDRKLSASLLDVVRNAGRGILYMVAFLITASFVTWLVFRRGGRISP